MALAARNSRTGAWVARKVGEARTLRDRTRGLLGRDDLPEGEALWLEPCSQVHTFFMAFPIDVLFLDREGRALRVVRDMKPWRISPWVWWAAGALELAAGSLEGKVEPGDRIEFLND